MRSGPRFVVVPVTLRGAAAFIRAHHRHHKPSRGALFAIGAAVELGEARVFSGGRIAYRFPVVGGIVGVAVVGRPIARMLQRGGWTSEALRVATDGTRNACSFLYARAWRAAQALGWRRLVTYTLPEEGGGSLRASGLVCVGNAGGGSWDREDRPRIDEHPTQEKLRWEAA